MYHNNTSRTTQTKRRRPRCTFPPEVLAREEVERLFNACSNRPEGIRNQALIVLLYRAGLRISEALALLPKDLSRESGAVRILYAKGGRSRTVGMDQHAFAIVDRWLAKRRALGIEDAEPLFCTTRGSALRASYIRVLLPRLAVKAGLLKRIHAHGLRHTRAAELREEGVDIGIISKQLGHQSIATTAHYLDHIAPLSVVQALRGREW